MISTAVRNLLWPAQVTPNSLEKMVVRVDRARFRMLMPLDALSGELTVRLLIGLRFLLPLSGGDAGAFCGAYRPVLKVANVPSASAKVQAEPIWRAGKGAAKYSSGLPRVTSVRVASHKRTGHLQSRGHTPSR